MNTQALAKVSLRVHEAGSSGGCPTARCGVADALLDPTVVTGAVLFGLVCLVGFAYVADARSRCREERRRVTDERDAFAEFADRVAELSPSDVAGNADAAPGGTPAGDAAGRPGSAIGLRGEPAGNGGRDPDLDAVVEAYRETVVAVPHFETEYDETVAESLAEELGYDAAVATVSGDALSPGLQAALIARSRRARARRDRLVEAVDEELDALDAAESTLSELDRERRRLLEHLDDAPRHVSFDAVVDVWQRLSALEGRCDEAVERRQDRLRNPPMETGDGPPFYEYLYDSLSETTHPVLRGFTRLVDDLRSDRRGVERRLAASD